MSSVTIDNIKVDFDPAPKVTFLQGCDMDIFSIQDTIREIEESEQGQLAEFRLIAKIWGNENFSADGSQKDALSLQIQEPYVIDFELGAIPFSTSTGNLLGSFVTQSVIINNSIGAVSLASSDIQYSSFGGGVSVDVTRTGLHATGTEYPAGNQEFPVNNLADAVVIAGTRFDTLFIKTSMFGANKLESSDISGFTLVGESAVNTIIEIGDSLDCSNLTIREANIFGVLGGGVHIYGCSVGDISHMDGSIHDSGLYGTITLAGNEETVIADCYTTDQDNPPVIDMGSSGQDLSMPDYSGIITITNLSSGSEEVGIGLSAGLVILDSTIAAGSIVVSGVGLLQNNSTGTADVNVDGLINRELITKTTWENIYINVNDGVSGTAFPLGTLDNPVDNLTDALAIGLINNIQTYILRSNLTIDQDISGMRFYGKRHHSIDLNGQTCLGSIFIEATTTGIQASKAKFISCRISDFEGMSGNYRDCVFLDEIPIVIAADAIVLIMDGRSGVAGDGSPVFDYSNGGIRMNNRGYSGGIKVINSTDPLNVSTFEFLAGKFNFESDNTAGNFHIRGVVDTANIDASGGATVVSRGATGLYHIADPIAEAVVASDVEGSLNLEETLRLILAATTGSSAGAGTGTFEYKSVDGTITRIRSTFDVDGNRQITLLDAS